MYTYKDSSDCLLLKWGSHAKALLKYSSTCPHERVAKVVREYNSLPEEKKQGQYTTNYLPEHSPFSGTPYPCHSPFTLYNFHRHLPDQPFVHISWKVWLIGPSCAQRELCSVFPLFHHHFSSKMATRWRNALGLYKTYHVTCCWPVQTHNIHVGCRYYKIYCKIIKSRTFGNLLKWLVFIFSYQ